MGPMLERESNRNHLGLGATVGWGLWSREAHAAMAMRRRPCSGEGDGSLLQRWSCFRSINWAILQAGQIPCVN